MDTLRTLEKNLNGYINRETRVRSRLFETVNEIVDAFPETVIFGGMIREFALGQVRGFSSDIDMVTLASETDIYALIKKFDPIRNKFGGFRFVNDKQVFDIWSFSSTWAFREGALKGENISDLLKTTFFNVDAAIYNIKNSSLSVLDGYDCWINERVLDLNFKKNPSPEKMIKRVMRLVVAHQFCLSFDLAKYILENQRFEKVSSFEKVFLKSIEDYLARSPNYNFRFNQQLSLFP